MKFDLDEIKPLLILMDELERVTTELHCTGRYEVKFEWQKNFPKNKISCKLSVKLKKKKKR